MKIINKGRNNYCKNELDKADLMRLARLVASTPVDADNIEDCRLLGALEAFLYSRGKTNSPIVFYTQNRYPEFFPRGGRVRGETNGQQRSNGSPI